MRDTVFVAGSGSISSCGVGAEALFVAAGGDGADAPRLIEDFDAAAQLGMRGLRPLSRASLLGVVAAADALGHPQEPDGEPERRGVVVGTRWASLQPLFAFEQTAARDGPSLVNPAQFPNVVVNAHAGYLGILFGLAGPNVTLCGAGTGLEAVGLGSDLVAHGRADRMLAGGVEALGELLVEGLSRNGNAHLSGPPGEGAAFLLLTREPAAVRIAAFTSLAGADHEALLRRALDEAGMSRNAVEAIYTSGVVPAAATFTSVDVIAGDCGAAGGALAAVAAAHTVAASGSPAVAAAFPSDGAPSVLVLTPAETPTT